MSVFPLTPTSTKKLILRLRNLVRRLIAAQSRGYFNVDAEYAVCYTPLYELLTLNKDQAMYGNPQRRSTEDVFEKRRDGGRWLKELREKAGLSQRGLAQLIDTEYYTFVSQLENGRGRIPPDKYIVWSKALNMEPKTFVKSLMRYYDPVTYEILFEPEQ